MIFSVLYDYFQSVKVELMLAKITLLILDYNVITHLQEVLVSILIIG